MRSVTSVRTVRTKRSASAFARGVRGGIVTVVMPASARTTSKDAVNWPARSRTRNRKPAARSPRSTRRFRICWVVHDPSGRAVTPRTWMVREPTSMAQKQDRRRSVTAQSTWKTSTASIVDACVRRNCRHVVSVCRCGAGGSPRVFRTRRIVEALTRWPRVRISPWIRWYPHVGFSVASRLISVAISGLIGGRPIRCGLVHVRVIRRRCHRRTVPGVTSRCVRSAVGRSRMSAARTARSAQSYRGLGWVRRSTATSCRSTSTSMSVDAGERPRRTSQLQTRTKIRYGRCTDIVDHHAAGLAPAHRPRPQAQADFWHPTRHCAAWAA